jgi:hypothetical protein
LALLVIAGSFLFFFRDVLKSGDVNKTVPVSEAYTGMDFMVVWLDFNQDNSIKNAEFEPLSEAANTVRESATATFLLPLDKLDFIESEINKNSETQLKISVSGDKKQLIELRVGGTTYCYEATFNNVRPAWKTFSDMLTKSKVTYRETD